MKAMLAGAGSTAMKGAKGDQGIRLFCDLAVDPAKEKEMLHNFHSTFRPAASKQPDNFPAQLSWGIHLVEEERAKEAEPFLVRARDLYPQYVGPDSPYLMLAELYRDRGDQ